jgi:hypothetical protein
MISLSVIQKSEYKIKNDIDHVLWGMICTWYCGTGAATTEAIEAAARRNARERMI